MRGTYPHTVWRCARCAFTNFQSQMRCIARAKKIRGNSARAANSSFAKPILGLWQCAYMHLHHMSTEIKNKPQFNSERLIRVRTCVDKIKLLMNSYWQSLRSSETVPGFGADTQIFGESRVPSENVMVHVPKLDFLRQLRNQQVWCSKLIKIIVDKI